MNEIIGPFTGRFRWLSNFYPALVELYGIDYPTVEHAYQAAKTLDEDRREVIRLLKTPGEAKRYGGQLRRNRLLRADWKDIQLSVMHNLLVSKFEHPELREKLLATGNAKLVEYNNWNDTFWGVCRGAGENHLGKLLMSIREYYQVR